MRPTRLELTQPALLRIVWDNGELREYTARELRERCPCATCREKRAQPAAPAPLLAVITAAEARPLAILDVRPIGNYAYGVAFSDGHDTGIFTLEFLSELGAPAVG